MEHDGTRTGDGEQRALRPTSQDGFTLVELLVVLIIVGVLAAIAIPAFLLQKGKAYETTAKSDVEEIAKEVVGYYIDSSGPLSLVAGTAPQDWQLLAPGAVVVASGTLSSGNAVGAAGTITSDSAYCVAVTPSAASSRTWRATQDGLSAGDC